MPNGSPSNLTTVGYIVRKNHLASTIQELDSFETVTHNSGGISKLNIVVWWHIGSSELLRQFNVNRFSDKP